MYHDIFLNALAGKLQKYLFDKQQRGSLLVEQARLLMFKW